MIRKTLPEKLNICLVAQKFPIHGRAADYGFLWPIARGLARNGHKVTVIARLSPQQKEVVQNDGVTAYFLDNSRKHSLLAFQSMAYNKFIELHQNEPFQIVHSFDQSGFAIAQNRKKLKVVSAFDISSTQISQIFSILGMSRETLGSLIKTSIAVSYKYLQTYFRKDRRLLSAADGVFVSSPQERIILERYYFYPDARIYTVPYGIEIATPDYKEQAQLKESLEITDDNQCIVTVSDMTEIQEIKNLLKAFEIAVIKKPDLRLIVLGNGPKRKEIEYEIYNLALGSKVILTGAIKNTEISDYISLGDVFINISGRTTGFEPTLLEAMNQEKVIIGSEVSAMSSIVDDGLEGFLMRPADIQSISTLIIDIFSGELDTKTIGKNARKKVTDLFDTAKMVETTLRAYRHLLYLSGKYKRPSGWTPLKH